MKNHNFYREFANTNIEDRLALIDISHEPTSLLVIFKQLQKVRAQKRFFEQEEERLLSIAEIGFNQLNKKDGKAQRNQT